MGNPNFPSFHFTLPKSIRVCTFFSKDNYNSRFDCRSVLCNAISKAVHISDRGEERMHEEGVRSGGIQTNDGLDVTI